MATPVNIRDSSNSHGARVSRNGELYVAPIEYSDVYQVSSSDIDSHEVVPGKPDKRFIVKSAIIAQDKTNTDVNITLTQADDGDGTNPRVWFEGSTTKSDRIIIPLLDVQAGTAKWINFQHDSATATISMTITGYYVDA